MAGPFSLMLDDVKGPSPSPCLPLPTTGRTRHDNVLRTWGTPEQQGNYGETVIPAKQNDENVHWVETAPLSGSFLSISQS